MDPNSLMGDLGRYPTIDDCLISSFGTERRAAFLLLITNLMFIQMLLSVTTMVAHCSSLSAGVHVRASRCTHLALSTSLYEPLHTHACACTLTPTCPLMHTLAYKHTQVRVLE